ncbi:hypothetical protein [Ulvibacterium sp.]|uniref:hypothetical protein n=1 Tax=Ulvibacterium sp. TaxID=2665914 RepID=UPI0026368139|nr:hypothetical protein [Ulvibacterium sp.]
MMASIINKKEILDIVDSVDVTSAMEKGFVAYSAGKTVVPPVAELLFEEPKGETHIKYGYIKGEEFFCVKIASGFYGNTNFGISSSQGLMLLFNQKTGETRAVLLDDGHLTNIRTAAAGALAAKYFAPRKIKSVGIIGTGIQGRLQLLHLQKENLSKSVWVWGRNKDGAMKYKEELEGDFDIQIAESPSELAANCNLIYTTTPAENPLLKATDILPGTHITAVGSDTPDKQELEGELVGKADIVIADSIPQSQSRGEIYRAVKAGKLNPEKVVELGNAIQNKALQRSNDNQISVVDLTGVAVQDIMIAEAVYKAYQDLKN